MNDQTLTQYEANELQKIRDWRDPAKAGFLAKVTHVVNRPFEIAGDAVMKIPGVEAVISTSVGGLIGLLNDGAQWSVRPEAVYSEYRGNGLAVNKREDILALGLEGVDKNIGFLAAKYKTLAAVEGAATGVAGIPGIPVDIVALVGMNLRAIGEYATYCGFDVNNQNERLYAMHVLGLASSPTDASKQAAMAQLIKIATEVAKRKTWKELERHAFVKLVQQLAKALGVRLTKAKLAQIVPATGALIGSGFNAYYTSKVCTAANFLYRERFLAE